MKILAPLLLAFLVVACQPTVPPIAHVGPAPSQSAEVTPVAKRVRDDAAKGAVVSGRVETGVDSATKKAQALRDKLDAAQAETDRLRKQTAFTTQERDSIFALYDATKKEVRNLFTELEAVKKDADLQKQMRVDAEANLLALTDTAALRDLEVVELRAQRDDFVKALDQARASLAETNKKLMAAEKKAAVGGYLKGMLALFTIAAILIVALWVFLKSVKPL